MPKAAVIMGSDSDYNVVKKCTDQLEKFGIDYDMQVISAHRNPDQIFDYVRSAEDNGIEIIIGAAGKAAHLPGIMAGLTTLPVIGIPIKAQTDLEITVLANLITMTPGTLSLDISPDRKTLYVHAMYIRDPEALRRDIQENFEPRVLALLR